MSSISMTRFTGGYGNPQADISRSRAFADNKIQSLPFFNLSNAKGDIQKLNWKILNQAMADARRSTTNSEYGPGADQSRSYKQGAADLGGDQVKALNMLMSGQAGSTGWKDVMGNLRNQFMNRYEGEQGGLKAQQDRIKKLGIFGTTPPPTPGQGGAGSQQPTQEPPGAPTGLGPAGGGLSRPIAPNQQGGALTQALTGGGQQQQQQSGGTVYGGYGQSPLSQALQGGGQAQVTSGLSRFRPMTSWGSGGFRSPLGGF